MGRTTRAVRPALIPIILASASLLTGCNGSKKRFESADNLKQLAVAVLTYQDQHGGAWPDSLEQVKPLIGTKGPYGTVGAGKDFATLTHNPLTGADPGYEYAKPAQGAAASATVMIYQLRDGKRDDSLDVAFGDGSVRKIHE